MFSIRRMRREDVADAAELERKIFTDAWSEQAILETLNQRQTMLLAAYEDKELIGYLILYYVLEDGEVARIAVADGYKRQGVATLMFRELANLCGDIGVSKLLLDVRESNTAACAFYEDFGFVRDGIRKNFYRDPAENAILMSLELGR